MLKIGIPVLGLLILFAVAPLPKSLRKLIPFQQATITIDPSVSYQTMVGWEAVAQAGQIAEVGTVTNRSNVNPAFPNYKNPLFDSAVNDLGLNRLRLELRSGLGKFRGLFRAVYKRPDQFQRSESAPLRNHQRQQRSASHQSEWLQVLRVGFQH